MNISIQKNTKLIKSKENLFNDSYLNRVINLLVDDEKYFEIIYSIRHLFYMTNEANYEREFKLMITRYYDKITECKEVYHIFKEWKPYDKYDMGECRGIFLELLSYKLLIKKYGEKNIFRESNLIIGQFQSHTWDAILKLDNSYKCYECKFSSKNITRSHLNSMIGTKNKSELTEIFLVSLDIKFFL